MFQSISDFIEDGVDDIRDFIDRFHQEILPSAVVSLTNKFRYDMIENEDGYIIQIEMPGVRKQDTNIFLEEYHSGPANDERVYVVVEGEKQVRDAAISGSIGNHSLRHILHKERKYGKRSRSILLPNDCDLCQISSKFDGTGVLFITIPRLAIPRLVIPRVVSQNEMSENDTSDAAVIETTTDSNVEDTESPVSGTSYKTIKIDD